MPKQPPQPGQSEQTRLLVPTRSTRPHILTKGTPSCRQPGRGCAVTKGALPGPQEGRVATPRPPCSAPSGLISGRCPGPLRAVSACGGHAGVSSSVWDLGGSRGGSDQRADKYKWGPAEFKVRGPERLPEIPSSPSWATFFCPCRQTRVHLSWWLQKHTGEAGALASPSRVLFLSFLFFTEHRGESNEK